MRIAIAGMICGSILLSGCWASYRYRANLDVACSIPTLKNQYRITRFDYLPWPLEDGTPDSVYENLRKEMESALHKTHPELFAENGRSIAVSVRSVASESSANVPLAVLNAMLSLLTLGVIPAAGGFTNDFIIKVNSGESRQDCKVCLRADNCASMGIVPTALLWSYSEDSSAQYSAIGKSSLAERDRQAELLLAKSFGAGIIQLLQKYETTSSVQGSGARDSEAHQRKASACEKLPVSKDAIIEIDTIPL